MREECCGTCCDKVDISQQIAQLERQRNVIAREAINKLMNQWPIGMKLEAWLNQEYPI